MCVGGRGLEREWGGEGERTGGEGGETRVVDHRRRGRERCEEEEGGEGTGEGGTKRFKRSAA